MVGTGMSEISVIVVRIARSEVIVTGTSTIEVSIEVRMSVTVVGIGVTPNAPQNSKITAALWEEHMWEEHNLVWVRAWQVCRRSSTRMLQLWELWRWTW
jgi:flavorubredoxin